MGRADRRITVVRAQQQEQQLSRREAGLAAVAALAALAAPRPAYALFGFGGKEAAERYERDTVRGNRFWWGSGRGRLPLPHGTDGTTGVQTKLTNHWQIGFLTAGTGWLCSLDRLNDESDCCHPAAPPNPSLSARLCPPPPDGGDQQRACCGDPGSRRPQPRGDHERGERCSEDEQHQLAAGTGASPGRCCMLQLPCSQHEEAPPWSWPSLGSRLRIRASGAPHASTQASCSTACPARGPPPLLLARCGLWPHSVSGQLPPPCTHTPSHTPRTQVRKEINDWVARYRRDETFSGRPSYGNVYSAVNAMAGHLNSFGPTAPVPKKRLERMIKARAVQGLARRSANLCLQLAENQLVVPLQWARGLLALPFVEAPGARLFAPSTSGTCALTLLSQGLAADFIANWSCLLLCCPPPPPPPAGA